MRVHSWTPEDNFWYYTLSAIGSSDQIQLTDSTYVYVWVGGGAHPHVCPHTTVEARCGYYFLGDLHLIHGEEASHLSPKFAYLASLINQLALGIPWLLPKHRNYKQSGVLTPVLKQLNSRQVLCKAAYPQPHYGVEVILDF